MDVKTEEVYGRLGQRDFMFKKHYAMPLSYIKELGQEGSMGFMCFGEEKDIIKIDKGIVKNGLKDLHHSFLKERGSHL